MFQTVCCKHLQYSDGGILLAWNPLGKKTRCTYITKIQINQCCLCCLSASSALQFSEKSHKKWNVFVHSIIVAHTESCCNIFTLTSFTTDLQPVARVHSSSRHESQTRFSGSLQKYHFMVLVWCSPRPAPQAFLCLLIFRSSRHFTTCTFQRGMFEIF